ncbi:MAG: sigma-54-dependent Fis family transcriptional regulator [candidate division Zixibacteria bacterium]|nr:sigma-54-dependent Fis family transcriptional regulator [candidate division Zixibacteria bacterium]
MPATLLIVEDNVQVRSDLSMVLEGDAYAIVEARDGKEALSLLEERSFDLMILDLDLPRVPGMEVLRHTVTHRTALPVVILSGKGTIRLAVEATQLGAYDFLEKPLDGQRLLVTVRNALEKCRLQRQRDRLMEDASRHYRMVGASPALREVFRLIDRAAAVRSRVLITGESGTGKELVARAIHYHSGLAVFVDVNCAAIPETLIEDTLFGHKKGAFTNAAADRPGKFELAHDGTLFLDEIGEMTLATQAKVLRALSENLVERVGDSHPIPVNARIIAATNKDIEREVREGNFREDLYYRLNVITTPLSPLRERREDIPDLTAYFLHEFAADMKRPQFALDPGAMSLLMGHDWPGNIRQLRNVIERLVVLEDGPVIAAQDVACLLKKPLPEYLSSPHADLRAAREQFEREYIHRTLIAHLWKIQDTAAALGIERTHLWKKMKRYGIREA